jgi:hypothetical protein
VLGNNSNSNVYPDPKPIYRSKDPLALQRDCVAACSASKQAGIEAASRYYQQDLPRRISAEKQTLAQLTGWGLAQIDDMPGAQKYLGSGGGGGSVTPPVSAPPTPGKPWWEQLFNTSKAAP